MQLADQVERHSDQDGGHLQAAGIIRALHDQQIECQNDESTVADATTTQPLLSFPLLPAFRIAAAASLCLVLVPMRLLLLSASDSVCHNGSSVLVILIAAQAVLWKFVLSQLSQRC